MPHVSTEPDNFSCFKKYVDGLKVHRDQVEGPSLKKPLLLLLVISHMHRGILTENRIRFTDIEQELASLIREFCWKTLAASPSPEQPFERLASSPLWQIHIPPEVVRAPRRSLSRQILRDPRTFAALDDALFRWLKDSELARRQAAQVLLERWCPAEKREAILTRLAL